MVLKHKRILFTAAAAVMVLATVLAGTVAFAKPAGAPADPADRTINVNGNAQVTLKPDIAYITFGTLTQDVSASAARSANNQLMAKVYDALKAQGVDTDKDVTTTNYAISPRYDQNGSKITGYDINNSIQVKVRDLTKLGAVMQAATTAGANLSGGLYFDVENREAAYSQALEQAIANARLRAETLAKSAGATLGAVVSASESGGYNPYPINFGRQMLADASGVPVSSGTLQVGASVSVTFELK